ncbi:MAG: nucleotide exchange factor GrpE [Solitalea sp.]
MMKKENQRIEDDIKAEEGAETATSSGEQEVTDQEETQSDKEAPSDAEETVPEADSESDPADQEESESVEKLKEELADANDKYLRLLAEFDNFKRRSVKERVELIGTASKSVILTLLPILDDFERAEKSMESATDVQAVKEGIDLIVAKLKSTLAQQGLKEMESIGTPFNADLHEAISNVPAPSEDMKGKVVDQLEKGYFLNDKVIRFAKVFVGA